MTFRELRAAVDFTDWLMVAGGLILVAGLAFLVWQFALVVLGVLVMAAAKKLGESNHGPHSTDRGVSSQPREPGHQAV